MIEWWHLFWTDARTFTATLFAIPIFCLFAVFVFGLCLAGDVFDVRREAGVSRTPRKRRRQNGVRTGQNR